MGTSHGNFVKYPRTPHLFGSKGTSDDRHLTARQTEDFLRDSSLIVEEKLDGTNVGLHFAEGELQLQCRGHLITAGMHPQYDLFKQWAVSIQPALHACLRERFILFGEWMYAKHTIHYRALTHYFYEFDIFDKEQGLFLTLERRLEILASTGIPTVPILHRGAVKAKTLRGLVGASAFDSEFESPDHTQKDALMEGLYLRTEQADRVSGRAKYVRPEFIEKIKLSNHWQSQRLVPNQLVADTDIFDPAY